MFCRLSLAVMLMLAGCAPARIPLDEVVDRTISMYRTEGKVRLKFRIASDAECVGVLVERDGNEDVIHYVRKRPDDSSGGMFVPAEHRVSASSGPYLVAWVPLPRGVIEEDAPYTISAAGGTTRATILPDGE